jgi:hypothetical protein
MAQNLEMAYSLFIPVEGRQANFLLTATFQRKVQYNLYSQMEGIEGHSCNFDCVR